MPSHCIWGFKPLASNRLVRLTTISVLHPYSRYLANWRYINFARTAIVISTIPVYPLHGEVTFNGAKNDPLTSFVQCHKWNRCCMLLLVECWATFMNIVLAVSNFQCPRSIEDCIRQCLVWFMNFNVPW